MSDTEKKKLIALARDLQHELSGMVVEMGMAYLPGVHPAVTRSAYDHRHEFMNNRAMELVYALGALADLAETNN